MSGICFSKLNKWGSMKDGRQNIFSFNKRGQFFILSAVIIASIIVSLATVQNYVATGDVPAKFYYYSDQLEQETGAVVDYALYNSEDATKLTGFLQQGISRTMDAYPSMDVFSCYSSADIALICQNNGTRSITINTSSSEIVLSGIEEKVCAEFWGEITCNPSIDSIVVVNEQTITITPNGSQSYNIKLVNSSIQRGQFYFILQMNTSSGKYLSGSTSTN